MGGPLEKETEFRSQESEYKDVASLPANLYIQTEPKASSLFWILTPEFWILVGSSIDITNDHAPGPED
jgi:hypothetical protein